MYFFTFYIHVFLIFTNLYMAAILDTYVVVLRMKNYEKHHQNDLNKLHLLAYNNDNDIKEVVCDSGSDNDDTATGNVHAHANGDEDANDESIDANANANANDSDE